MYRSQKLYKEVKNEDFPIFPICVPSYNRPDPAILNSLDTYPELPIILFIRNTKEQKKLYKKWRGKCKIVLLDDVNDLKLFGFLKGEISKVLVNDNVEFRYCQNDPIKGEYVTFRPYVFDRIGEDVDIFYSHFKGYGTSVTVYKESFPMRIVDYCFH